jgi:hypothetical protein
VKLKHPVSANYEAEKNFSIVSLPADSVIVDYMSVVFCECNVFFELSFVFCGINQLLSQLNINIRFFYLTMVSTVERKTFLIETVQKLVQFGFIRCKIVLKNFKLNLQIVL